ncbi:hypothetical protein ACFPRL_26565 [Pseudoclavibacter helvolus]
MTTSLLSPRRRLRRQPLRRLRSRSRSRRPRRAPRPAVARAVRTHPRPRLPGHQRRLRLGMSTPRA